MNEVRLNVEQALAYNAAINGKNIFITSPAGCGKTFVIKKIKKDLEIIHFKNVALTSTTGTSASILGSMTLHSFLGIGLGTNSFDNLYKKIMGSSFLRNRWRRLEVLIIDEVSMLTIELFEKLEKLARAIRENDLIFGGVQIILSGDFLQLPPVADDKFLFESEIWGKVIHKIVYLKQPMRQKDPMFVRVLNKVRIGEIDEEVRTVLKSREIKYHSNEGFIPTMLYSTNAKVDACNKKYYEKLDGPEYSYKLKYHWHKNIAYKDKYDQLVRFVPDLKLKVGAQVMHLVNAGSLVNGSRGIVKRFEAGFPVVLFTNGAEIMILEHTLDIEERDEKIMSYTQLPLRLAYGVTIHKSQSQEISLLRVNLDNIGFAPSLAYVALSRATNLEGLYIRNLNFANIFCHPKAAEFYRNLEKTL